MATNEETVAAQQLYVSYYGRPADPAGLAFWMEEFADSDNVDDAVREFGTSAEFTALSAGLSNAELVNALYQQMFNRDADAEGLAFYLMRLDNNEASLASIALQIADGVQGDDVTTLANKVAVANTFTTDVDTKEADYRAVNIAEAQALLSAVDATAASVATGNAAATALVDDIVAASGGGVAYTLTPGTDIIESGIGDDTYAATATTLNAADIIVDSGTADSDTLSVVVTTEAATAAATVSGVEAISVELDVFVGASAAFNAANVSGAVITLWSDKLGFDGNATVNGAGNNAVTAGADVTGTLTVNDLDDGVVDAGSAAAVTVETVAGTTTATTGPTITVNGTAMVTIDATTTTGGAPVVTINATADGTITLVKPAATNVVVTGDGEVTLLTDLGTNTATITGALTTGTLNVATMATGPIDVGASTQLVTADTITLLSPLVGATATMAAEVTVATGQSVIVTQAAAAAAGITFIGAGPDATATAPATNTATVTTTADQSILTFSNVAGVDLTVVNTDEDGALIGALTVGTAATTVTSTANLTVGTTDASNIDFSGVSGDLTIAGNTAAAATITGGSGDNVVLAGVFTDADGMPLAVPVANTNTLAYFGGAGSDLVNGTAFTRGGTLAADTGAGDDRIVLSAMLASGEDTAIARVAVNGGDGNDSILLVDGSDISGAAVSLESVEAIVGIDASALTASDTTAHTLAVTLSAAQLSDMSYAVLPGDAKVLADPDDPTSGRGLDTLEVIVESTATDATVDLSGLVILDAANGKTSFVINGINDVGQDIVGTSVDDTINAGTATAAKGNSVTGGGGDNTFVFVDAMDSTMGNSTAAAITTITDYTTGTTAGGATEDNDTLDLVAAAVAETTMLVIVPANSGGTSAASATVQAIFAGATGLGSVIARITGGVLELVGLPGNTGLADLDDWVTIALEMLSEDTTDANVLAFEFEGSTYVLEDDGVATANVVVNLIELAGITGIEMVSAGASGANTILIV